MTIASVFVTPFADARMGLTPLTAHTAFSAEVDKFPVHPSEAATIEITGTVPARPGTVIEHEPAACGACSAQALTSAAAAGGGDQRP
jgi:hypothetical protein